MENLQQKLLQKYRRQWGGLLALLILFGGVLALDLYFEYRRIDEDEQQRLLTQVRVLGENTERLLLAADSMLQGVRAEIPRWKNQPDLANAYLNTLAQAMPGIRFIGIMDDKGILQFSNRAAFIGRDYSQREYFQAVKRTMQFDQLYVSPPFVNAVGIQVIALTRMLSGPRGEFAGVVVAMLDPEYFNTLMYSVLYARDMWSMMLHDSGKPFLMSPAPEQPVPEEWLQRSTVFSGARTDSDTSSIGYVLLAPDQAERMIARYTVRPGNPRTDHGLLLFTSRERHAIFARWRSLAWFQGVLWLFFALITVSGLFLYQRRHLRSEQEAAEARQLNQRFRLALDHIPTYIYMKDAQRRYIYANRATLKLFGCTAETLGGSDDARFFPPETVAHLHAIDRRVLEHGEDTAEQVEIVGSDGEKRVYWEIKTPLRDENDPARIVGLCGISTDITEHEALKARLAEQAQRDYLTGLFNRRYFMEHGQIELARVQRYGGELSLFTLDVDHFKKINDSHGHKAGDITLQKLAELMREMLRTTDIVARIGGEEFAILLPETSCERALEVAERLRAMVAQTPVVPESGPPLSFTVSIGLTHLQHQPANLDMLLGQADWALYQAKAQGRNRVYAYSGN